MLFKQEPALPALVESREQNGRVLKFVTPRVRLHSGIALLTLEGLLGIYVIAMMWVFKGTLDAIAGSLWVVLGFAMLAVIAGCWTMRKRVHLQLDLSNREYTQIVGVWPYRTLRIGTFDDIARIRIQPEPNRLPVVTAVMLDWVAAERALCLARGTDPVAVLAYAKQVAALTGVGWPMKRLAAAADMPAGLKLKEEGERRCLILPASPKAVVWPLVFAAMASISALAAHLGGDRNALLRLLACVYGVVAVLAALRSLLRVARDAKCERVLMVEGNRLKCFLQAPDREVELGPELTNFLHKILAEPESKPLRLRGQGLTKEQARWTACWLADAVNRDSGRLQRISLQELQRELPKVDNWAEFPG